MGLPWFGQTRVKAEPILHSGDFASDLPAAFEPATLDRHGGPMQSGAKPTATDDRREFVVIPSDQVRVAPSDAEITDLLRAAARQHSEAEVRAALEADAAAPVPAVDATFRATAVNDDVPGRKSSFGRRVMRAVVALLVAAGITGAAVGWQFFGYATKKAVGRWLPQMALTSSLTLDNLRFGSESKPSDKPADAQADVAPAQAAASDTPAQNATDGAAPDNAAANAAAPSSDPAQQLQSMARDLASANQEIETLKASIAELKASQQQMARDLAKATDKVVEQGAKAKIASAPPRPAAPHKPAATYSPSASYSPSPAPAPPPAYRPSPSSYAAQAAVAPSPASAQPYVPPPPIPLRPADPDAASAPRPPMPVQ
jgi:hypothetical protein